MAQTYNQIQKQIQQLQRQAEILRIAEIKGVVERIKVAIAHYGFTPEQLGFGSTGKPASASRKTSKTVARPGAKFIDGSGNMWSGRGPRPHWLRDALNAGRTLEEFSVGARPQGTATSTATSATPVVPASKKTKRAPSKRLYSDDAGHTWSGMGPKPYWLKAAMDGGKTLEDFAK